MCYTSGYYCHEQGSNSKYSCQIPLFFQHELLTGNTASSFSAVIQHSQRKTQQSLMPRSYSRPSLVNSKNSFFFDGRRKAGFPNNSQFSFPFKHLFILGHTQLFTASYLIFPHSYSQLKRMNRKISISAYPT